MKKFVIAAALILFAAPALAGTEVTTTNCKRNYIGGGTSCQTISTTPDELPRPARPLTNAERKAEAAYHAALAAERTARIEKWEAFCKPVIVQDKEGINRYTYAHKNCDIGRSE